MRKKHKHPLPEGVFIMSKSFLQMLKRREPTGIRIRRAIRKTAADNVPIICAEAKRFHMFDQSFAGFHRIKKLARPGKVYSSLHHVENLAIYVWGEYPSCPYDVDMTCQVLGAKCLQRPVAERGHIAAVP
jgi:hypothetical protein